MSHELRAVAEVKNGRRSTEVATQNPRKKTGRSLPPAQSSWLIAQGSQLLNRVYPMLDRIDNNACRILYVHFIQDLAAVALYGAGTVRKQL
ncbi:MAG: hypothetical protein JWQ30_2461 [Sediminibacterium sp.]|nr:hypothetical protein [Sediminibacterium sp.]